MLLKNYISFWRMLPIPETLTWYKSCCGPARLCRPNYSGNEDLFCMFSLFSLSLMWTFMFYSFHNIISPSVFKVVYNVINLNNKFILFLDFFTSTPAKGCPFWIFFFRFLKTEWTHDSFNKRIKCWMEISVSVLKI